MASTLNMPNGTKSVLSVRIVAIKNMIECIYCELCKLCRNNVILVYMSTAFKFSLRRAIILVLSSS